MTEDTLMTADSEIDRLRADLLTARGEAEDLSGEVARLREENALLTRGWQPATPTALRDEIERLREIIRDLGTCVDWYVVSNSMKQRVREALGDVPEPD